MLVVSPTCFGLVVRGRRRDLKLRQIELARAVGVGRDWIIDLEAGRAGLDLSRVLRTLEVLDIAISVDFCRDAPAWTIPFTQDAAIRKRRLDNLRPRRVGSAIHDGGIRKDLATKKPALEEPTP